MGSGDCKIAQGGWTTDSVGCKMTLGDLDVGLEKLPNGPRRLEHRLGRLNNGPGRLENGFGRLENDSGRLQTGLGKVEIWPQRLENCPRRLENEPACWKPAFILSFLKVLGRKPAFVLGFGGSRGRGIQQVKRHQIGPGGMVLGGSLRSDDGLGTAGGRGTGKAESCPETSQPGRPRGLADLQGHSIGAQDIHF